jgi:Cu+-exporting ATPase
VAAIALLTYLLGKGVLAATAVLVVACSCSFALATPMAMLASIGAGARRGLPIKGGAILERLARADVFPIDKTGDLTLGQPAISDVVAVNGASEAEVLRLAATAERYLEHPLGEAVRRAGMEHGLQTGLPEAFQALPGLNVQAVVDGKHITPRRKSAPGATRFTPGGHGTPGGAGQIGVAAGAQ